MEAYLADRKRIVADHERLTNAWKRLHPTFGALRPDQITRELCQQYRAMRKVSDGTILKELGTLRAGIRWFDPTAKAIFEMPSTPPARDRFLSQDEARALEAACRQPHVRLFVVLALTTAARKQAIFDLVWDRVDFDRGIIRLATGEGRMKGRAAVPLHDKARPLLLEARRAAVSDYVIEVAGKPIRSIRTGFDAACARANLRGVTPHVLRHTAAVWMAEGGTPMSEIAQYLGHSDSRITERVYARYSPDHLRRAAAAIRW
ncbi:MAG: site-specific integrase [Geminicoccaceae bacterium]